MLKTKKMFGVLLPLLVALLFAATIYAQTDEQLSSGSGFKVSPARYDVSVDAGNTETRTVSVRNVTSGDLEVIPLVDDFIVPDDESGNPVLAIGENEVANNPNSIKPFVTPLSNFDLDAGEEKDVTVTISIPEDTAPGAYYGVVRFAQGDLAGAEEGSISLTASVGTIFLVTVPGATVEKMSLVEISAGNFDDDNAFQGGRLFNASPDVISIRLENEGNTFIAPFGTVNITDWSGNIVTTYEMNNTSPKGNIIPNSVRRFTDGIDNLGSFGKYTVTAHISYGDGGSSIITAQTTFWIVPWFRILVITSAVVLVFFGGTRGIKAYNRRIIENQKGSKKRK